MITTNYKLRTSIVFFFFMLLYSIICIALYRIQVVKQHFFLNLAEKQYKITVTQNPPRGNIVDRHNKPIALNKESLSAFIIPNKLEDPKKLQEFLKKHFVKSYERYKNNKNKYFMYLKRKLSKKEIALIEQAGLKDIKFLKEPSRFYPYKSLASIIGLTDIDNNGTLGVELAFNKQLSGQPTTYVLEKDARSSTFYFEKETKQEGQNADTITLTIDSDLQFAAYNEVKNYVQKFKAKEGCAIIIDPSNGHILAMTNYPTFNPNATETLNLEKTKNRSFTESYELGSVMKVIVAMAALEEKVVTPDELIDCENTKETSIKGMHFTTVHPDGIIPFSQVIVDSNNIGMAKVAFRLEEKLADYYKLFGFGKKTGIELGGEQDGFVNPPKNWSKRSIISLSFGYEVTSTILQLAKSFAIISNDGFEVNPTLLFDKKQPIKKRLLSHETIETMKEILKNTVEKGTAKKAIINGYNIMGKTGTANMVVDGKYSYEHNVYTFAGIIEKDNYKRVIVTFVKDSEMHGIYAAQVTAPLFNKIAEKMLIHEKILN